MAKSPFKKSPSEKSPSEKSPFEKSPSEKKNECPICVKKTMASRNLRCPYCSYSCCKQCYQTWLLSSDETVPRCMNAPRCQREFSSMFIFGELSQTFRKEYTKKLGRLSLQVEKQRLPLLQDQALVDLRFSRQRAVMAKVKFLIAQLQKLSSVLGQVPQLEVAPDASDSEPKSMTRKCGRPECGGFLTTRWRCPVCETYTCSQCGIPKTGEAHDCNPDDVATMTLLRHDTKACPKCSVPIHKIDGCAQMFCVQCHTAFDWNTLRIERGRIHNPHYYEIQRQMASGREIPREPGDIPAGCGEVETIQTRLETLRHLLEQVQRRPWLQPFRKSVSMLVTSFQNQFTSRISHLQNYEIQLQRQKLNEEQVMKRRLALSFLQRKYEPTVAALQLDAAFFESCPPLAYRTTRPFCPNESAVLARVMGCLQELEPKTLAHGCVGENSVVENSLGENSAGEKNTADDTARWETELRHWETSKLKRTEFADVLQTFTSGALDIATETLVLWCEESIKTYEDFCAQVAVFEAKIDRLRGLCNDALVKICLVFNCVLRTISPMAPLIVQMPGLVARSHWHGLEFETVARPKPGVGV